MRVFSGPGSRWRVPAAFSTGWLLLGLFCFITSSLGGHPPLGALLWAIAVHLTLQGRVYVETYGSDLVGFAFSLRGTAQTLAEVALIGAAVGLIFETAGAYRRTHRVFGCAILLAYLFAHALVVPVGESRTMLARRLQSPNQAAFISGIERIRRSQDPRDVDLLVALFPAIMKEPEPPSSGASRRAPAVLDTITLARGVAFWRDYLQSEQGQAGGVALCTAVLESAESTATFRCRQYGKSFVTGELDTITADVAQCYARELRAGRCEIGELLSLGRQVSSVLDEHRVLLMDKLMDAATSPASIPSFGFRGDPDDPCYVKDPELRRLITGGAVLRDLSRDEIARVFDHWRACPSERMYRRVLRESHCG